MTGFLLEVDENNNKQINNMRTRACMRTHTHPHTHTPTYTHTHTHTHTLTHSLTMAFQCRDAAQNRLLCGSGDFDVTIAELTETMRDVEQKLRQLKVKWSPRIPAHLCRY